MIGRDRECIQNVERVTLRRSKEECRRAMIAIASFSESEEECKQFLSMFGFIEDEPRRREGYDGAGHPRWALGESRPDEN